MPWEEFSTKRTWSRCQRSGRKDAAALHWGLHTKFVFFNIFLVICNFQLMLTVKWCLSCFQRSDQFAGGDARTSGSVSPADFFTQTPKEASNFQIPVSCGKYHLLNISCDNISCTSSLCPLLHLHDWWLMTLFFWRHWWVDKPGAAGGKLWGSCGSVSEWRSLRWSHPPLYQRRRRTAQENSAKIPKQAKEQYFNGERINVKLILLHLIHRLYFSRKNLGKMWSWYSLSSSLADILSSDPELERHRAELWIGQLEGGSCCSPDLRSPWRLCPSVR